MTNDDRLDPLNLYVSNFSENWKQHDFDAIFSQAANGAQVVQSRIFKRPTHGLNGTAFVRFEKAIDAEMAMRNLDDNRQNAAVMQLNQNEPLYVRNANKRHQNPEEDKKMNKNNVYIHRIHSDIRTTADLARYGSEYGPIDRCNYDTASRSGHVRYRNAPDAQRAIAGFNLHCIGQAKFANKDNLGREPPKIISTQRYHQSELPPSDVNYHVNNNNFEQVQQPPQAQQQQPQQQPKVMSLPKLTEPKVMNVICTPAPHYGSQPILLPTVANSPHFQNQLLPPPPLFTTVTAPVLMNQVAVPMMDSQVHQLYQNQFPAPIMANNQLNNPMMMNQFAVNQLHQNPFPAYNVVVGQNPLPNFCSNMMPLVTAPNMFYCVAPQ